MQLLDPRQQQEEQRRQQTAQSLQHAEELAKLLTERGQNKEGQPFTSPWQVAGQWAQALAGRSMRGQNAQASLALNSLGAPGVPEQPAGAAAAAAPPPAAEAPAAPGGAPQGKVKPFSPDISQAIKEGAAAAGVDPNMMAVFAHIESGGRAGPEADTHSYKGLMQVSNDEMARVSGGKGNVYNPKDSVMAAGVIARQNQAAYERFTGRPASPFDLYMMHQQGPAGYLQHLANPAAPAWENMASTGEGKQKGEHWAKAAITGNGGHVGDTSGQFLDRWRAKFDRLAGGDHNAFAAEQPQGQPGNPLNAGPMPANPAAGGPGAPVVSAPVRMAGGPAPAPAAPAPAPGGAPSGPGLIERGQFVDPRMLPQRPPAPYTLPQIQAAVRAGVMSQADAVQHFKAITEAAQPMSIPFAGGQLTYDPRNPAQQTYMPSIQTKPVKVGDIETQQSFWVDSQGRQHVMPSAPEGGAGAAPGAAAAPAGVGPAPAPGTAAPGAAGDPFPGGGSMTDIANWGERRKVRIAGEEEGAKTQASAITKTFNGIYAGLTGAGDNAAHQAQNIALLREIAPAAYTGGGANTLLALNRMAARLGVDPKGAAPRELFNTLAARVLSDQFSGMRNLAAEEGSPAARVFKSMLDIEEKANITHEDTLEGVMAKLNMLEQAGKQAIKWADMADDHVAKHGSLDPTFMKRLRKDISEAKFEDVVSGEKGKGVPPPAAGETSAAPAKRYRYNPETRKVE